MKVERNTIEEYLARFFVNVLTDKENKKAVEEYAKVTYSYPEVLIADVLGKRKILSEVSDFDLFVLVDSFKNAGIIKNSVNAYFTDVEIEHYSKAKYKAPKKIKFPLKFNVIEIAPDQWIGRTTAREIVALRDAQIIRYNVNIQRTMRKGMKGKTEEYRIMENKRATSEIRAAMQSDMFIPNTLTLNIPDDIDSEFDFSDGVLTIKKAKALDIIDGFHRLIALEQAANLDPDFDYVMELRITNYSEDKGQRFVYQEDQKTKMSKIDSNSFNVDDEAVRVCRRLNDDSLCNIQGQITRNEGLISLGEMALILKRLHFHNLGKNAARVRGVELAKELREDFNRLTEYDGKYLTERYDFITLAVVLVAFKYFRGSGSFDGNVIDKVIEKAKADDKIGKRLKNKLFTGPTINLIEDMLKEGGANV